MKNYPTTKTNVRTRTELVEAVRSRTDNYNRYCSDALTELIRKLNLGKLTPEEMRYIYGRGDDVFEHTAWKADTRLITYRLRKIDVDDLRFKLIQLSRALNLAIKLKLDRV